MAPLYTLLTFVIDVHNLFMRGFSEDKDKKSEQKQETKTSVEISEK